MMVYYWFSNAKLTKDASIIKVFVIIQSKIRYWRLMVKLLLVDVPNVHWENASAANIWRGARFVFLPRVHTQPPASWDLVFMYVCFPPSPCLLRAVLEESAYGRIKQVVRWYLSGFYKKPKVSVNTLWWATVPMAHRAQAPHSGHGDRNTPPWEGISRSICRPWLENKMKGKEIVSSF